MREKVFVPVLLLLAGVLSLLTSFAQERTLSGIGTDEKGNPLPVDKKATRELVPTLPRLVKVPILL